MKKLLFVVALSAIITFSIVSCKSEPEQNPEPESTVTLTGIAVTQEPISRSYLVGQIFNPAGMVVTATYSDLTKKVVTAYTYSPTDAFTQADASSVITITYKEGNITKTATCTVAVAAQGAASVAVTGITISNTTASLAPGETFSLTTTVLPENATDKIVSWTTSNSEVVTVDVNGLVTAVAEGTAAIIATTQDGGNTATCTVNVKGATKGTSDGHTWVQLWTGGPKWAEFNVGSTITSYEGVNSYDTANVGNYYKWGATTAGGSESSATADIQGSNDDTASSVWGTNWQMPTMNDMYLLMGYCTWTWCDGLDSHYDDGDTPGTCTLAGYKITGNTTGYTKNSIFLPAPYMGLSFENGGYYWSSTPSPYMSSDFAKQAHYLSFDEDEKHLEVEECDNGFPVRAILKDN